jgi:hypothetical protein
MNLNLFISRVMPVLEGCIEDNLEIQNLEKPKAKEMNSYEEKAMLAIPKEVLQHLGSEECEVTCVCSFDDCPQNKSAVGYLLRWWEEEIYVTVVYHLSNATPYWYLLTKNKVTALCSPVESYIIVGTSLGSLCVFDL